MTPSLVTALVAVGALTALAPVAAAALGRRAGWPIAAGLVGVAALLVVLRPDDGSEVTESVRWLPTIGVSLQLRLDGLSFLFAMVVLLVGAVVMVYSTSYVRDRTAGFFTLMTAFAAAMLALVLADDLVVMFVAWELTTLCSYLLILRSGPTAGPPATRTLIVTAAGGLCLLGAVTVTAIGTGTTTISEALADPRWAEDPLFASVVAVLVALAAMTKSAQFPFHSWLPDAMVAPAPVSAYLHAAAMVKAGIYLLMLFAPAASASPVWQPLLVTIGLLTAVMGAVFALQRTDLKELLAYSTVSHLGLLVAVIAIGTSEAMLAAAAHVVAHALFKSAGFMHVGMLERRTGTRDIRELSGLARGMPWGSAMIALAALSMAGVPPLLGFVSKEFALAGFFDAPFDAPLAWTVALVATLGAVLTVAYSLRILVGTLPGEPIAVAPARETVPMTIAIGAVALTGGVLGLVVGVLDPYVVPAAADAALGPAADAAGAAEAAEAEKGLYLWNGFSVPVALSVVALVGGVLLTLGRARVDAALDRPLFPGTGVAAVQAVLDGAIAGGRRVGDLTRHDRPSSHLVVPIVLIGAGVVGLVTLWPERIGVAPSGVLDVGLTLVLLAGIGAVIGARSRLTAVVATGVAGFSVALWFLLLGAVDVAATQLLVEILTVVVIVLVLRRMRPSLPTSSARRRAGAGVAAVAVGLAGTLATLVFTGRDELSRAGAFYLRETGELTGGSNLVNVILVDFRALDTLGELVVLAIGAVSVTALMRARAATGPPSAPLPTPPRTPIGDPARNSVFLSSVDTVLVPLMLIGSAYAVVRGHDAPGGGFIGALIGVSAVALAYLSADSDDTSRLDRPYLGIAGGGILVAVGAGLVGLLDGSFLAPVDLSVLGYGFTTALVFDVGVYLAVFGVILAALRLLGTVPVTQRPGAEGAAGATDEGPVRRAEEAGRR